MTWEELLKLFGAAGAAGGIGAVVASLVNQLFTVGAAREARAFEQKKEAYTGFLTAHQEFTHEDLLADMGHHTVNTIHMELGKKLGDLFYWNSRIAIVGSAECVEMAETVVWNVGDPAVDGAIKAQQLSRLLAAMRKDLRVEKSPSDDLWQRLQKEHGGPTLPPGS